MEDINQRVLRAKYDDKEFSALVRDYRSFLLSEARKNAGKYITVSDDEYSIVLSAFHEAVISFDETKGQFLSFARIILSRRLIDHIRKQSRNPETVSLDDETNEDKTSQSVLNQAQFHLYEEKEAEVSRQSEIRYEIEEMQKILKSYGFSFYDLSKASPKAEKTKKSCTEAIVTLLLDNSLSEKMQQSKMLPIAELERKSGIPRKILERHRKYIIAAAEIFLGDFPHLASYMNNVRKAKWEKEARG